MAEPGAAGVDGPSLCANLAPLFASHPRGAWLALDTSTDAASLALLVAGQAPKLTEVELPARVVPSEELFVALLGLLRDGGIGVKDLAGIVVGLGPGSFTGLRVGLASVKGLALGTGCPLYGTSSFALLASGAPAGLQVVARDARRGQAYLGLYELAAAGSAAETVVAPQIVAADALAATAQRLVAAKLAGLAAPAQRSVHVQGDMNDVLLAAFAGRAKLAAARVRAAHAFVREQPRLLAGAADDPVTLAPVYLQDMPLPGGPR